MRRLHVNAGNGSDIVLGSGLISRLPEYLSEKMNPCRVMLVCDENVSRLYSEQAESALLNGGFAVSRFTFPAGEQSKTILTLSRLLEHMGAGGMTRTDAVLALGGGVCCDLAGFAASVYMRGVDAVYVPTTLMAAVDAAVGGKTGVDLSCGKNLAGSFCQPKLVLCDCDTFRTLPETELSCGMAEVIKYALGFDAALFAMLEKSSPDVLDYPALVSRCCALKIACVEQDERDTGARRALNLGHTVGHAVEQASGYAVRHGFAVAAGLCTVTRAAESFGLCEAGTASRLEALCGKYGLPVTSDIPAETLFAAAERDKKRSGDRLTLAVPTAVGRFVLREMPFAELREWLERGLRA